MQKIIFKFTASLKKMKQLRVLTIGSMLVALYVLSSFFLRFYPSESVKISIEFLFIATAAYLHGPIMAMIVGGLGDSITWLLQTPGPFNPGITLCIAAMGLVFGLFYYNEKPSLPRCIIACVTETVIIELILKTYALKALYGTTFTAVLMLRLLPSSIMLVVMIALTYAFFKAIGPIKARLDHNERALRR